MPEKESSDLPEPTPRKPKSTVISSEKNAHSPGTIKQYGTERKLKFVREIQQRSYSDREKYIKSMAVSQTALF